MKASVLVAVAGLALATSATAQGVRIVTPDGGLDFPDIQPAIDAASDGDVLLIGAGLYSGFTVDGTSLSLVGVGGPVTVLDEVSIVGLEAQQAVLLSGIDVAVHHFNPALEVTDCRGFVRLQDCRFEMSTDTWWNNFCPAFDGGPGVRVENSARVAFLGCTLQGSVGESTTTFDLCVGGTGGAGLFVRGPSGSRSEVALYDCTVIAGHGGGGKYEPGTGGVGIDVSGAGVYLSGTSVHGGNGGVAFVSLLEGPGGNGVLGVGIRVLDCAVDGGTGLPPGAAGDHDVLVGTSRHLDAPSLAVEGEPVPVALQGLPGDEVWLLRSRRLEHRFHDPLSSVLLLTSPLLGPYVPRGFLPASGVLRPALPPVAVPPGATHSLSLVQGVFAGERLRDAGFPAGDDHVLSGARHLATLSRTIGPDCNGNGISDYVDVITGSVPDADHDLIPDTCSGG